MNEQEISLQIPDGIFGPELKSLLFKFANALSALNERRDKIDYERELQDARVESVAAMALLEVTGTAIDKKAQALHCEIELDGESTSAFKEKKRLIDMKFRHNRAKSRVKELEGLIDVCRSGLSYDKSEGRTC